ncbi:LOW QUALITY PROTEIN: Ricin B, lectin domain containing protein [Trema orientale]|uniref:Ricin B, lectin domain containing protein n=1 Tax=Trema orientale TaxID=63057 RepID=A0A2P5E6Z3_TREOI|nr:LOW QUALITY PROTEIN: Ricin B, lectin domain containing protein [Trema orientale]
MMACEKEDGEDEWTITFDGSSSSGGGAGIIVTDPKKNSRALAYKLLFVTQTTKPNTRHWFLACQRP